ncbi:hypothetical protein R9X47_03645 [Wukongibacter baidiensis]|uniref:hypothetical protein n=1 Tax=Wukongibacter baidiensis TaxID=1723361 RepID=UPI003D7F63BB
MSIMRKNEYLVRHNSMFYYFYLVNSILYLEILEQGKKKVRKKFYANIRDFSICVDSSDIIHIICLDTSNKLIHFFYKDRKWRKRFITNLVLQPSKLRDLKVYFSKNSLNIIFLKLENPKSDTWKILHLSISKNSWKSYEIGDMYFDKYLYPYKADMDTNGNIHLIYRSLRDGKSVLYYRMFNTYHSKWSLAAKLSSKAYDTINMNILCDTNDFIHVVWSYLYNKNIEVNYLKKKVTSTLASGWKKSKTFPAKISNFTNPVLMQCNSHIKLLWKQNDQFYYTEAKSHKDSWSSVKNIRNVVPCPLKPISYLGRSYKSLDLVKAPLTFGIYEEESFILGLDDPYNEVSISTLFNEHPHKETARTVLPKSKKDTKSNLEKYLDSIKPQIAAVEMKSNLLSADTNTDMSQDDELDLCTLNDLSKDEFIHKLYDLYDEIDNLKEQKKEIKELLKTLEDKHRDLNSKVEKIRSSCQWLK